MDELTRLGAIEEIKQLKAWYFYCVDNKDWATWIDRVWAPDGELHVPEARPEPYRGAFEIAEWSASMLADCVSIHQGYTPIIEILSERKASGIWAMEDIIVRDDAAAAAGAPSLIHGWGHYHECYVLTANGWRIATSRLTRLRVETTL